MSHVTKVACSFNDVDVLKKACEQLNVPMDAVKDFKFSGSVDSISGSHTGYKLTLAGWQHPVIVLTDGSAVYDNYNGNWGKDAEFDKVKQEYSAQTIRKIAKKKGYKVKESVNEEGVKQLIAYA